MKIEFISLELRSLRRKKSSNEMSPVMIDCVETADKQRKGSLRFVFLANVLQALLSVFVLRTVQVSRAKL